MKLRSKFALLDVTKGRKTLLKRVGGRGTPVERTGRSVPVVIYGDITEAWGGDDGTSREFEVRVTRVEVL